MSCYTVVQFLQTLTSILAHSCLVGWLRGTRVERWSYTGELSLSYARPTADG